MYFRGWLHSWFCGDCPDADAYWRLRAFWAGRERKGSPYRPPKRCPCPDVWANMWDYGESDMVDELGF